MRKGTRRVMSALVAGKACRPYPACWTDGTTVYSYRTPILVLRAHGGYLMNTGKYSRTTTAHQMGIKTIIASTGADAITEYVDATGWRDGLAWRLLEEQW